MEHFKQFAALLHQFDDNVDFARMLAKAAFRAPDPLKAAEEIIAGYEVVLSGLTQSGVDPHIARTLASSSRFRNLFRKRTA
jgi:hypothetical protein